MVLILWSPHSGFCLVCVLLFASYFHIIQCEDRCPQGCKCGPRTVDCLHGKLITIPYQLPSGLEIQRLNFARNRIRNISHELDAYAGLQFLSLATNNISSIESGAFERLAILDTLLLSRNFICDVDRYTFANLTSLKHLDISYNAIRILRAGIFSDLRNLKSLDLTRNKISVIESDAFEGLQNLEVLNMTRNELDIFPVKSFQKLVSLKMLILDDNLIRDLPAFSFSRLLSLEDLSITGNKLQSISPTCFMTSNGSSVPLRSLSLRGAHLQWIPENLFRGMVTLKVLDLTKTKIKKLTNRSLDGLWSLQKFMMTASENLSCISEGVFVKMFALTEVVIRENPSLTDVSGVSFVNSGKLKLLNLSDNSILTFSKSLVNWSRDVVVDLRGNNFVCDCRLSWLPTVFSDIFNNQTNHFLKELTCASPSELKGQTINSVAQNDFRCTAPKRKLTHDVISRVKIGVIAAAVLACVFVIFLILMKYRKQLCLFLRRQYRYSAYKNKNGIFTVNADNDDITTPDEETPMDEMDSFSDDVTSNVDAILVSNNNRKL